MLLHFRRVIGRRLAAIQDRLTVGQQISLATATLCFGLIAIIAAGATAASRYQTAELIKSQMTQMARSLVNQLEIGIFDIYRELEQFVSLEALVPVWLGPPERARAVLDQLHSNRPEYVWAGFVSPEGVVLAGSGGQLEGRAVAGRTWFQNALTSPSIAVLTAHEPPPDEAFRLIDIGFPIWTPEGRLVGVLAVQLSWEWVKAYRNRVLYRAAAFGTLDVWILAPDNSILIGDKVGRRPFSDAVAASMRETRAGAFVDTTGGKGELTGYAVMPQNDIDLGWMIVARLPEETAFARSKAVTWVIVGIGGLLAAIGIAFAILMGHRIAHPIQALTREADRLGRDPSRTMLPRQSGSTEVVQLSTALRSLLRRIGFAEQRTQEAELRASENALQFAEDMRALRKLADTDALTNLMNRRAFLAAGCDALEYYKRYDRPLAVMVIDIDRFKQVNDHFGHAGGDAAIRRLGELIQYASRATDKAARFGGEEFVVLLREVDEATARFFAERLCAAVEAEAIVYGSNIIRITISIGVALAHGDDRDIEDTIERADRGLYMAKNTGRNRVFFVAGTPDLSSRHAA
jgi:diguanylate cyclase (GGDEF)-like protein